MRLILHQLTQCQWIYVLNAVSVEIPVLNPPINEDPSFLTEIREAISKLRSGKAASICSITAEMIKLVVNLWCWVCMLSWLSSGNFSDLLRCVVIPL